MSEKPVLEYQPKPLVSSRRRMACAIALISTCTLATPSLVFGLGDLLGIVHRDWLAGDQFNQCLRASFVCDGIGFILAIVVVLLGKPMAGALLLLVHLFGLFILPGFRL